MKSLLAIFLVMFVSFFSFGQVKGLYISNFKTIINDPVEEQKLLTYAQQNGFTYLAFYNLYYIHNNLFSITDPITSQPLSDFIYKAKTQYGITQVGAVGETLNSFIRITNYNNNQPTSLRKFDVMNYEFLFSSNSMVSSGGYYCNEYLDPNYTCDQTGAFQYYLKNLKRIDSLSNINGLLVETYIESADSAQCSEIGKVADRVLLQQFRKTDTYSNGNSIYNFKKDRYRYLTGNGNNVTVMPVFNSTDDYMGDWLNYNPESKAFDTFMNGQNAYLDETASWTSNVNVAGYQWYSYSTLSQHLYVPLAAEEDETENPGNQVLSAIVISQQGDQIMFNQVVDYAYLVNSNGVILQQKEENVKSFTIHHYPIGIYNVVYVSNGRANSQKLVLIH